MVHKHFDIINNDKDSISNSLFYNSTDQFITILKNKRKSPRSMQLKFISKVVCKQVFLKVVKTRGGGFGLSDFVNDE